MTPVPFDSLAWHRACNTHGLALTRYVPPLVGGVVEMRGLLNGVPVVAWLCRGMVTLGAFLRCRTCGCDVAVEDGKSSNTVDELVAAIVAIAPDVRCATCRGPRSH